MSLSECLADPVLQKALLQYCGGQPRAEAGVLFWLEAQNFQGSSGDASTQFQELADKYFVTGSPQELTEFDENYQLHFRQGEDRATLVKAAQDAVFCHLEAIVFPGFVSSSQFQQALASKAATPSTTSADSSAPATTAPATTAPATTAPATTAPATTAPATTAPAAADTNTAAASNTPVTTSSSAASDSKGDIETSSTSHSSDSSLASTRIASTETAVPTSATSTPSAVATTGITTDSSKPHSIVVTVAEENISPTSSSAGLDHTASTPTEPTSAEDTSTTPTATSPTTSDQETSADSPSSSDASSPGALTKRVSVYDRYGQKVIGEAKSLEAEGSKKRAQSVVERGRETKWIRMLRNWPEFCVKNPRKFSSRVRKGIPDAVRARAWSLMLGSDRPDNAAKYEELLKVVADSENKDVIDRDVNRTFSDYVFFRQKEGQSPSQGRSALRNVLRAYACHDKELGYCQGMSFQAGVFLMYATEEQAFWMLEGLLSDPRWNLRGMFLPGFPLLNEYYLILDSLMKQHTPKLRQKLLKLEVATAMFAQEWFMTLFACCIPFESFLRVMDILLYKGYKILFQLAIAMLKTIEQSKELPTMDFATLLLSLKGLGGRDKYRENTYAVMDTELLLKNAFQIQFSTAKINKLSFEIRKSQTE